MNTVQTLLTNDQVKLQKNFDLILERLQSRKDKWVNLAISKKIALLQEVLDNLKQQTGRWIDMANIAKGLEPSSPLSADEWYEV